MEPTNCMIPSASRWVNLGQKRMAMPMIPMRQTQQSAPRNAVAAKDKCLQHQKPDRRDRHNQRGEIRWARIVRPRPDRHSPATNNKQPMVARRKASSSVMRILRPKTAQAASISGPAMRNRMAHITTGECLGRR